MKFKFLWLPLLVITIFPKILSADLKKIVTIGSDEINYLFFVISSAVLDDNFNIYIADGTGSFVRKYDSRGKFVKEIGKFGQGPGDFSDVLSGMNVVGRELNLLDGKNRRVAVMDTDLNIQKYVPIRHTGHGLLKIRGLYYLLCPRSGTPFMNIAVYDEEGNFKKEFFDGRPSYMDKAPSTRIEMAAMKIFAGLNFNYNKESGEIVIVPQNPGATIEIFFYSPEGHFLRKLDVNHLIRYHFPFKWELPIKYPEQGKWIYIGSIHCLSASNLLLEYSIVIYKGGKAAETHSYLLIIDTITGKRVHEEMIDPSMNIMDAKGKTICVRTDEGDINKVVVFELIY